MLATMEGQIEEMNKEILVKDKTIAELIERMTSLQSNVTSLEIRLKERIDTFTLEIEELVINKQLLEGTYFYKHYNNSDDDYDDDYVCYYNYHHNYHRC